MQRDRAIWRKVNPSVKKILMKVMRSRGGRQGNPLKKCCLRLRAWQKSKRLDYILELDAARKNRPGPRAHGDKQ